MSAHTPAFHSFSVPTSPATTRPAKGQPVTPQRLPRHQHRHSQSAYRSPNTPSTPYTPLSLRSSDSGSSTLTTPDNVSFLVRKRLGTGRSPDVRNISVDSAESKGSLADLAENWRARASQHGIRVSSTNKGGLQELSHFGDDEASDKTTSDVGNDSSILSVDESLLPPPFMSYHRRSLSQSAATRPRALSHASMPENNLSNCSPMAVRNANCTMPLPSSPVRTRRALGAVGNVMSTPPPNRALSAQLKLKGSLTDPAQPRRREAFGAVPMLSNNVPRGSTSMNINLNHDTSLDLFNIHEHDYEYDSDLNNEDHYDESFSLDLQNHTSNVFGYPSNGRNENKSALNHSNTFADPFFDPPSSYGSHVLNTIPESVEHQFHASQPQFSLSFPTPATSTFYTSGEPVFGHYLAKPSFVALPQPGMPVPMPQMPIGHPQYLTPTSTASFLPSPVISVKSDIEPAMPLPPTTPTDCSVCLASYPSSLAVLQPCAHPLCSACLTSALNIVGEKDMQCAVCNNKVANFDLVNVKKPAFDGLFRADQPPSLPRSPQPTFNSFTESTTSQFGQSQELDSAFELGFDPCDIRASTPKLEHQSGRQGLKHNAVLRIDNVPWDITPRQITGWLQQPVERVYVLLDNKGKTLSHAYVEVKDPAVAGAILRGETSRPNAYGRKERGSVLGRGKRARGVTVTRSTQEELMTNLFPSWRGTFDGPNPSLARLEADSIARAIEVGLLTESEINSLRHLIQSPDSHFLKVPVLPFHSLITLLCKFPPDIDSRVFWPASTRDKLFDLACVGLRELIPRVEKARQGSNADEEHTMELVHELAKAAVNCQVFTGEQVRRLSDLLTQRGVPVPPLERSFDIRPESSGTSTDQAPSPNMLQTPIDKEDVLRSKEGGSRTPASFEALAKEFGVEADLVQALAHRLAGLS